MPVISGQIGYLGSAIRAKKPVRLPVVMTREEVKSVLRQLSGDKWLAASLMYGSGLCLKECLEQRVQGIDLPQSTILVRAGKGNKDRVTMLGESLKVGLSERLK